MTISQPTRPLVPRLAIVLSVIAGALIIINSLYWMYLGSIWGDTALGAIYSVVVTGTIFGLVVIYCAYRLRKTPSQKITWGALAMLFSVFGLVTIGGGFVIGFVLGIVGGALAVRQGQEGE